MGVCKPGGSVVEYTGGSTGVSLVADLCGETISAAHREFGRLLPGEARSHENPGSQSSDRAQRRRRHDGKADSRHGRGRPRDHRKRPEASGPIS